MANPARCVGSINDVAALLPKYQNSDADIRFMTLVDLCTLLNRGPPTLLSTDYHTSASTIDSVLKLLDDSNSDVQSQALKSIGPLVSKLLPEMLCPFLEKVMSMDTSKSQDSSMVATATKTFVLALPHPLPGVPPTKSILDAYNAINRVLIPRLLGQVVMTPREGGRLAPLPGLLRIDPQKGVDPDAVDVLIEAVRSFGSMLLDTERQALQKRIADILDNPKTGNISKKKAVVAMSALAVYLPDVLMSTFISHLAEHLRRPNIPLYQRKIYLMLMGSVAHSVPQRFGAYLATMAPFVLKPLSPEELQRYPDGSDDEEQPNAEVDDVREAALIALEEFLSSCPFQMRHFMDRAMECGLFFLTYDPTLAMDDGDEMADAEASEALDNDSEEEDYEQEALLSDADDSGWKIRRCAAKVLHAIIATCGSGDLLETGVLYDKIAPALIKSFREREESVRLEVIASFADLIRSAGAGSLHRSALSDDEGYVSASSVSNSRKRRRQDSSVGLFDVHAGHKALESPTDSPSPISGARADLERLGPQLLEATVKLLKGKDVTSKQASMSLLRNWVIVQQGALNESVGELLVPILAAVEMSGSSAGSSASTSGYASTTGSSVRIEALRFIKALCETHTSPVVMPFVDQITPVLVAAVEDDSFKISSEAISVAESVVKILCPLATSADPQAKVYTERLFEAILAKSRASDTDHEVRQNGIHALGVILVRTGKQSKALFSRKRSQGLEVLIDRLRNETTRLVAVDAVGKVSAAVKEKEDVSGSWIKSVALELANQLRKSDRALGAASLGALRHLVGNPVTLDHVDEKTTVEIVDLVVPILDGDHLSVLNQALVVLRRLVERYPSAAMTSKASTALCQVVMTPMSGHPFDAYIQLLERIGASGVGKPLMDLLLQEVGVAGDPSVVGVAIGTLIVSGGSSVAIGPKDILTELKTAQDDERKCLALSILGEVSFRLGSSSPMKPKDFMHYFSSKSSKVARAAAVSLGRAGSGDVGRYLPAIMAAIKTLGTSQVLLLHSIQEILQHSKGRADLAPYTDDIWKQLLRISEVEDNKAVGAECVGRLLVIDPRRHLSSLQDYVQNPTPSVRGMIIQALRFAVNDPDERFTEALKPALVGMLTLMLKDSDLENRRLALTTLNAASSHKPTLVLPHLPSLLPFVFEETVLNPSLIREVQMGPFKHKVDDGLELRKSAFETLYAFVDTAYSRIPIFSLYDRILAGLNDEHDIRTLCNLMLTKLIALNPGETFRSLDAIVPVYQTVLSVKLKDQAVKQEIEKAAEASKDVLRMTIRLQELYQSQLVTAQVGSGLSWKNYWDWVLREHRLLLAQAEHDMNAGR